MPSLPPASSRNRRRRSRTGVGQGLRNYARAFTDSAMLASLGFTFFYAIATTLIVTLLAIPLAVVLNEAFFGRNFVLAVFFFPAIPSVAVLGVVLAFILSPLKSGAANSMLAVVGIDPVPWLADAWLARLSTVIVSVLGADRLACGPLSRVYPVDPEGLL